MNSEHLEFPPIFRIRDPTVALRNEDVPRWGADDLTVRSTAAGSSHES